MAKSELLFYCEECVDKTVIEISEDDCFGTICDLYDNIAFILGYKDIEKIKYDCKKIRVTEEVFNKVRSFYKEEYDTSDLDFGLEWIACGPKADLEMEGFQVEIENGFIYKDGSFNFYIQRNGVTSVTKKV